MAVPISSPAVAAPSVLQVTESLPVSSASRDIIEEEPDSQRNMLEGTKRLSLGDLLRDSSASPILKYPYDSNDEVEGILQETKELRDKVGLQSIPFFRS